MREFFVIYTKPKQMTDKDWAVVLDVSRARRSRLGDAPQASCAGHKAEIFVRPDIGIELRHDDL
ncbi:hypothetical protein GCM10008171_02290 [Methylopila jiangsuensis]|uniref:Uncharacterized protein n=1 Tax=Methylopila jiangsuensis TaxID=586230 RepID=A0A9W6JEJ2_9HYPH|nr:hypothetical protein GCM10008171_02290 [Methylopila jiangsuensis]